MRRLLLWLGLLALLLCSGCAVEGFGTIETNNQAGRLLIVTGPAEQQPDAVAAARALQQRYGRYALWRELDAATVAEPQLYAEAVGQALAETRADALILAPAYAGAAAACAQTELLSIAIQPEEATKLIAAAADLVLDEDYAAIGTMAVQQAAELGANGIVYYQRGSFPYSAALRQQAEEAAAQAGLPFLLRDLNEAGGSPQLPVTIPVEQALSTATATDDSCVERGEGALLALLSDDPSIEAELVQAALEQGNICLPQTVLSPYGVYGDIFGVDIPTDRSSGLSEYLRLLNHELVTKRVLSGHFAVWRKPLIMASIEGAAEFAYQFLAGLSSATDAAVIRQCLLNAGCKSISSDAEHSNYWRHLTSIRVFDETG